MDETIYTKNFDAQLGENSKDDKKKMASLEQKNADEHEHIVPNEQNSSADEQEVQSEESSVYDDESDMVCSRIGYSRREEKSTHEPEDIDLIKKKISDEQDSNGRSEHDALYEPSHNDQGAMMSTDEQKDIVPIEHMIFEQEIIDQPEHDAMSELSHDEQEDVQVEKLSTVEEEDIMQNGQNETDEKENSVRTEQSSIIDPEDFYLLLVSAFLRALDIVLIEQSAGEEGDVVQILPGQTDDQEDIVKVVYISTDDIAKTTTDNENDIVKASTDDQNSIVKASTSDLNDLANTATANQKGFVYIPKAADQLNDWEVAGRMKVIGKLHYCQTQMELQKYECSVHWSIHNFSYSPQETGEGVKSCIFGDGDPGGLKFRLELYPRGTSLFNKNYVVLRLKFEQNFNDQKVMVKFYCCVITQDGKAYGGQLGEMEPGKESGNVDLISRGLLYIEKAQLLDNDVLTVGVACRYALPTTTV